MKKKEDKRSKNLKWKEERKGILMISITFLPLLQTKMKNITKPKENIKK